MIIDENNIAHYAINVPSYETDAFYITRAETYLKIVQEAGGLHAKLKGVSITDLEKQNLTWVIARSRVEIYKYGFWNDKINISTFALDSKGFNSFRITDAQDQYGDKLFYSVAKWAIIDKTTGRPQKVNEISNCLGVVEDKKEHELPILNSYIEEAVNIIATYDINIKYLDTDYNKHVNNLCYTRWMLESLTEEFLDTYKLSIVDVRWLKQCYRHDNLFCIAKVKDELFSQEPIIIFEIYRREERDIKVFDAVTKWKINSLLESTKR